MKANTKELLLKAKTLQQQIKSTKQQQAKIYSELASQFTEAEKQEQIKEATAILENAKAKLDTAKEELKNAKYIANEMLEMVNAKNKSLPKIKNHIAVDSNGIATIQRNGNDKKFSADTTKANWQQKLLKDLEANGIGNGVARNIVYKISITSK